MQDFAITVNGFSKAFAMTGWRIGYLAAPPEIAERVVALHGHMVTGVCSFIQRAVALAMHDPRTEKSITEMANEYARRRDYVVKELSGITKLVKPRGTFYAFPDISEYDSSSEKFALDLLERAKVAVVPGASFGPSGEGFVRLSFATSMENLQKAFSRIKTSIATIHA